MYCTIISRILPWFWHVLPHMHDLRIAFNILTKNELPQFCHIHISWILLHNNKDGYTIPDCDNYCPLYCYGVHCHDTTAHMCSYKENLSVCHLVIVVIYWEIIYNKGENKTKHTLNNKLLSKLNNQIMLRPVQLK